jgi:hypothetical protein
VSDTYISIEDKQEDSLHEYINNASLILVECINVAMQLTPESFFWVTTRAVEWPARRKTLLQQILRPVMRAAVLCVHSSSHRGPQNTGTETEPSQLYAHVFLHALCNSRGLEINAS